MGSKKSIHQPKRILFAIAIVALFGGASIGIVGAATADDGTDGLPATWSIAPFRVGDSAYYTAGDQSEGMLWVPHELFVEALPATTTRADNGDVHQVITLDILQAELSSNSGDYVNWSKQYRIDSLTGETVSYDIEYGQGSGSSSGGLPVVSPGFASRSEYSLRRYADEPVAPCGFLPPFMGKTLDIIDGIEIPGCNNAAGEKMVLQADRVETFAGRPALVFVASNVHYYVDTEVWYTQDISMPVRVVHQRLGETVDWTMEGYNRGSIDYPASPAQMKMRPAVDFIPVDRYGPDWSGVDVEITIQEAIEYARNDPDGQILDDFLEANPDWQVFAAEYYHDSDDDEEISEWSLEIGGGDDAVYVMYSRRTDAGQGPLGLPVAEGPPTVSHWVITRESSLWVDEVPTMAPSYDSAVRTWADEMGQPESDAVTFGFETVQNGEIVAAAGDLGYGLFSTPNDITTRIFGFNASGTSSALYVGMDSLVANMWVNAWTSEQTGITTEAMAADSAPAVPAGVDGAAWSVPGPAAVAGLAFGAIIAGILYYFGPFFRGLPMLALFSRLRSPQLLEHPKRRAIMDLIEANPGIHFKELQRQTDLANGTLRHHARYLVQGGLVQQRAAGGFTCYFPGSRVASEMVQTVGALKSQGARDVFGVITNTPGASIEIICGRTGLASGTVGYHLKRLRDAGLVTAARDSRTVRLSLSPAGKSVAENHLAS